MRHGQLAERAADTGEYVTRRAPEQTVNMAPFARVVTWDPNRLDGARASRVEEFLR